MTQTIANIIANTMTIAESEKIDNAKPTFIGMVAGVSFYEHPFYGDENPLIVKDGGRWNDTHFWEVPIIDELY